MRTFIILLLLTNVAYFGWNQGWLREPTRVAPKITIPAATTVVPQPFESAPRGLTLISELSEAEREQLLASPLAVTAAEAAVAEAEASEGQSVIDIDETVVLPGETEDIAEGVQNQIVEEGSGSGLVTPDGPPWCAELGQFVGAAGAEALIPALLSLGVAAEVQTDKVPVSSTFWVYMPAFASQEEASRMLAELRERKIDSYYMRSGQFPGGISLGVFSRRASAERVLEALAAQGYTTQIGEVFREEPRSLLALRASSAGVVKASGWADFMAKNPGLTLTENVCESVASGF